jgi:hypothetical protein
MSTFDSLQQLAGLIALAFLRYVPAVVLPGFSPLRWAPTMVRVTLALGLAHRVSRSMA